MTSFLNYWHPRTEIIEISFLQIIDYLGYRQCMELIIFNFAPIAAVL